MNKQNVLNRIFSRNMILQCINNKSCGVYTCAVEKYIKYPEKKSNGEILNDIYLQLRKAYRNEYFYKNTLLNKLLIGVHSINTTTALSELPIAKSKADFLLINGKAVVYEIKTELDNLDRLESQINDYYKAFDHVAVVTCNEHITALQERIRLMNKPVGIYVLHRRGTIGTIQKPEEYRDSLNPEILFRILRKSEYEEILLAHFPKLPEVSAFRYFAECKRMFCGIPLEEAYLEVLKTLKKRANVVEKEFYNVPYELKSLVYFMNFKQEDYTKLEAFLEKPYGGV